jgi:hypothetical protein
MKVSMPRSRRSDMPLTHKSMDTKMMDIITIKFSTCDSEPIDYN